MDLNSRDVLRSVISPYIHSQLLTFHDVCDVIAVVEVVGVYERWVVGVGGVESDGPSTPRTQKLHHAEEGGGVLVGPVHFLVHLCRKSH